ncbi:MAG: hypothetical protein FDZ69_14095, partial [Deltaproteobacteria bacterium]
MSICVFLASKNKELHFDEDEFAKELVKSRNIRVEGNDITCKILGTGDVLYVSKIFADDYQLESVGINDVILNNTVDSQFSLVFEGGGYAVKSNFKLKPSKNKITFVFNGIAYDYNIAFVYSTNNDVSDRDYWFQKPVEWVTIDGDFVKLTNNDRKVKSLGFRRRYDDNVEITFDVKLINNPANLSIYFGQGTSIFVGAHDDRSIQFIQTKTINGKTVYTTPSRKYFKFKSGDII